MSFFFSLSTLEELLENGSVSMVTFLDVLGWKGIYRYQKDAIQNLKEIISAGKEAAEKFNQRKYNRRISVEIKSISDTIVIVTNIKKEDEKTYKSLIGVNATNLLLSLKAHGEISKVILQKSISKYILLRGATAFGSYEGEENILMGESVDEAAEWHEQTDWCGVILSPRTEIFFNQLKNKEFENKNKVKELEEVLDLWIDYENIPLKANNVKIKTCLDWISYIKSKRGNVPEIENLIKTMNQSGSIDRQIAPKYINTYNFISNRIGNRNEKQVKE